MFLLRRWFFFVCLTLSLVTPTFLWCYPFYFFDKSKINVHQVTIHRHVAPQIRNIIADFYHCLRRLHPIKGKLIDQKQDILHLTQNWNNWRTKCITITKDCTRELQQIYILSKHIGKNILILQKDTFIPLYIDNDRQIDSMLILTASLDKLSNHIYTILHQMEEMLIFTFDDTRPYLKRNEQITSSIYQMKTLSELQILSQLPHDIQKVFRLIWNFFIKGLEEYITLNQDNDFLYGKLEEFNTAWNKAHVKIAKNTIPVAPQVKTQLQTIHDRWNSILKIILNSHP